MNDEQLRAALAKALGNGPRSWQRAGVLLPVVRGYAATKLRDAADGMAQEALRAAKSTDPEQANAYVNAAQSLRASAEALEATQ